MRLVDCIAIVMLVVLLVGCLLQQQADPGDEEVLELRGENPGESDPAIQSIGMSIGELSPYSRSNPAWRNGLPAPPRAVFDPSTAYYWTLDTSLGTLKFRLRPDLAPMHVTSTVYLTRLGFYNGLTFHRIIPGFIAQGGCPFGTGAGNPGYRYGGEIHNVITHDRPGILSMANAGPGTDGCQFFVTLQKAPHLDGKHTVFGELIWGMDTLRALEKFGTRNGAPLRPIVISEARVTVVENGNDPSTRLAVGTPLGSATEFETDIIAEIDDFITTMKIDRSHPRWRRQLPRPPQQRFPQGKRFVWKLQTSSGPIEITLWPHLAPMHVSSTVYLTRLGFYDGLTFHRVIPGFMAQGGCPGGDGSGTPGYRYEGEVSNEVRLDRRGLLCMANAGPNTEGSQFYITFIPCPHLEGKDTVFGEVTSGLGTLDRIEALGSPNGAPNEPIYIESAEILIE